MKRGIHSQPIVIRSLYTDQGYRRRRMLRAFWRRVVEAAWFLACVAVIVGVMTVVAR